MKNDNKKSDQTINGDSSVEYVDEQHLIIKGEEITLDGKVTLQRQQSSN